MSAHSIQPSAWLYQTSQTIPGHVVPKAGRNCPITWSYKSAIFCIIALCILLIFACCPGITDPQRISSKITVIDSEIASEKYALRYDLEHRDFGDRRDMLLWRMHRDTITYLQRVRFVYVTYHNLIASDEFSIR